MNYDEKFKQRFSILQDRCCGFCDADEMSAEEFARQYPSTKELADEARYWLEMFYGINRGICCIAAEERYDSNERVRKNWRATVVSIRAFIKACEKRLEASKSADDDKD